jgi:hypothetical protein
VPNILGRYCEAILLLSQQGDVGRRISPVNKPKFDFRMSSNQYSVDANSLSRRAWAVLQPCNQFGSSEFRFVRCSSKVSWNLFQPVRWRLAAHSEMSISYQAGMTLDSIGSRFNVLNMPISTTAPIDDKTHVWPIDGIAQWLTNQRSPLCHIQAKTWDVFWLAAGY